MTEIKQPAKCPYCTDGLVHYDIIDDSLRCDTCNKDITSIEYKNLTDSHEASQQP